MDNDVSSHLPAEAWPAPSGKVLSYPAFAEVSRAFVAGYCDLVASGMAPQSVATAMLGATVNFYSMFGMADELPELLRAMADRLECTPS